MSFPASNNRKLPLTSGQLRLWVLEQMAPEEGLYNLLVGLLIEGPLNVEVLRLALTTLCERHDALRTSIHGEGGAPWQVIAPASPVALPVIDLRGRSEDSQPEALALECRRFGQAPFDLARGPLTRFELVTRAERNHVLLMAQHHIISDGWSIGILLRDLARLYREIDTEGRAAAPPFLDRWAALVLEEEARLASGAFAAHHAFWAAHLGGLPGLQLPTDRPEPPVRSFRGETRSFSIPAFVTTGLQALAHDHHCTLYVVLFAAWAALLHRYRGQVDFAVATVVANRTEHRRRRTAGLFANTLPIRCDLSGAPTFVALLDRMRTTLRQALEHQAFPLAEITRAMGPSPDGQVAPPLRASFVLENLSFPTLEVAGMVWRPWPVTLDGAPEGMARFDLSLTVAPQGSELKAALEYSTDLFDAATIEQMAGHLETLLGEIVRAPVEPIAALSLLTEIERDRLRQWSGSAVAPPVPLLHERFAAHVTRAPHALAVVSGDERMTYGELDRRSNQLAHWLIEAGIGPERCVAICIEKSCELMVAVLAVLKAGGAYVPLDPEQPAARLRYQLEGSGAAVLLTRKPLGSEIPLAHVLEIALDEVAGALETRSGAAPRVSVSALHLAYVVYTSGTTGVPKGTMVSHGNLAQAYRAWADSYGLADRAGAHLQMANVSFDVFSGDVARAFGSGAALVLCPRDRLLEPERLYELLVREQVECAEFVPAVIRPLLQYLAQHHAGAAAPLGFMKLVAVGSDTWTIDEFEALRRHCGSRTRLVSSYGLTEATIDSTYFERSQQPLPQGAIVPIGRPFPGSQCHIVDAQLSLVPVGMVGELLIGGSGVARGYLGRPGLTAERFIPDPFSGIPGARLYRTGDMARWLGDGNIDFLGRRDHQIKIRGFRIEAGEIEAALVLHPAVDKALVVAHPAGAQERRLCAYVVPREGQLPSDLRGFLRERLPAYMIPAAFVAVERFPLSSHGKIDRAALPAPPPPAWEPRAEGVEPTTPTEQLLSSIWAEVLRLPQVGRADNFFELGGDSILTIEIVSRARSKGLLLTPRHLFQHQTVAELATVVQKETCTRVAPRPTEGPIALTPIQRWFFLQDFADAHHWNQAVLLTTIRPLDPAWLEQALRAIVDHHEALRFRFVRGAAGWQQLPGAADPAPLCQHVDLSGRQDGEAEMLRIAAQAQTGLDLATGRLLRCVHFTRDGASGGRLLLVIHHLVIDGVSWRIVLEDLEEAYLRLERGSPPGCAPPTTTFAEWAARLLDHARSLALSGELDRRGTVPSVPPLPRDGGGDVQEDLEGNVQALSVSLSPEQTRALFTEVPRACRSQVNEALLAALARAFRRVFNVPQVRVDLEGHGREPFSADLDLSRTVGWFTTVHPVVLEAAGTPLETLKAVKRELRRWPDGGRDYSCVRYPANPDASPGSWLASEAASEVSFNYLGQLDSTFARSTLFRLAPEPSSPSRSPRAKRSHLLEIEVRSLGGALEIALLYNAGCYRPETIGSLARAFVEELGLLVAEGRIAGARAFLPSDFPLIDLDQPSLEQLLAREGVVTDLYALSPLQQGMLFHTLYESESGIYMDQLRCRFRGQVAPLYFQQAWEQVFHRHDGLRAAIVWEQQPAPVQVLRCNVPLPFALHDWRAHSSEEQSRRLGELIEADRARGFSVGDPPLLRLTLIQLADDRWEFLWSHHHILIDGWSMGIVLAEVMEVYDSLVGQRAPRLAPSRPFRDHIAWLRRQDPGSAESFWRQELSGFRRPTSPDGTFRPSSHHGPSAELTRMLDARTSEALGRFARQHHLTLNTLFFGAWGLLMSRYAGERDVVLGTTVSGRPAGLPGVETMVGLFINTLPLRLRIPSGVRVLDWLHELQRTQGRIGPHEHTSLVDIQRWSELAPNVPLFETLLVFQNHPLMRIVSRIDTPFVLEDPSMTSEASYPLALTITPQAEIMLHVLHDTQRFPARTIHCILDHLETVLGGFLRAPHQVLDDVPIESSAPAVASRRLADIFENFNF